MWVTRYKVWAGRTFVDWLKWWPKTEYNPVGEFRGGHTKRNATIFRTKKQAEGAIKVHKAMWGGAHWKNYEIHEVKVNEKKV